MESSTTVDIFPLWGFYSDKEGDKPKIIITRGRTEDEAWRHAKKCFSFPNRVRALVALNIQSKERYSENHQGYDWLHTPPLWLQSAVTA